MPQPLSRSLDPLSLMSRELSRLLRSPHTGRARPRSPSSPAWGVPVTLAETESGYRLQAAVPGVPAESLDVSLEGRVVTLRVSRPVVERDGRKLFAERALGDVTRRFQFARDVDASAVTARLVDGVLDLTFPFAAGPRRIDVSSN